jgi:hypothetical protein
VAVRYCPVLYWLFPAAGAAAAVAAALALATLALGRSKLSRPALAMLALSLVVGVGLVYMPLHYAYVRQSLPPINDIATDNSDHPAFQSVRAARAAERIDRIDTPDPREAASTRVRPAAGAAVITG